MTQRSQRSVLRLVGAVTMVLSAAAARADDRTVSVDALRTGWDSKEPGLSPSAVTGSDFGQLSAVQLDGQVYAQPVVVGSTVFTATENNQVGAWDVASGAKKWTRSLGPFWPVSAIGCGDLTPNFGVTSTPVYDASTSTLYVVAKVNDGPDAQHPSFWLHALDASTGDDRSGWPVRIAGSPSNDPSATFNAYTANQRAGLLLLDGVVYAAFASHCDIGPYRGYVAGIDTRTKALHLWTTVVGANDQAGIWQSGGGIVSDGSGRLFFATGNGISPAPGPGSSAPRLLAESVVRLGVGSDGTLTTQDFFSPSNADALDRNDTDLGSGGPMGIPDGYGTSSHPHLLVQVGKDGRVFLLDRDALGGRSQGPGGTDAAVSVAGPFQGVWGHPAFWGGDGGYVYVAGNGGPLRALKLGVDGTGKPTLTSVGTSRESYGYTSGSPVVTSDGTTSGSALVWVVYSSGSGGTGGELRAYDAVPSGGTLTLRYSVALGTVTKFPKVATDGGRVFVGTRCASSTSGCTDGKLFVFGRPATSALQAANVDFGTVNVGATGTATQTVQAIRAVTINSISTSAPFAVSPPTLPVTLAAGQSLTVSLRFSPTSAGAATGTVTYGTTAGNIGFGLRGTATQAGLSASPASLDFGSISVGTSKTLNVSVTNTGSTATTVTGVTAPSAPFTVLGAPAVGSSIAPGASVSLSVTYAPTAGGTQTGSLTVASSTGNVTVALTGAGETGAPRLTLTPGSLDFGAVSIGSSVTKTFTVANGGTAPLTITKAKAPAGSGFSSSSPLSEGIVLNPGQSVQQSVTFAPTVAGAASTTYEVTGNDGQGAQFVTLSGTGVAPGSGGLPPAPAAGSWTLNGSATFSGSDLVLTPALGTQAGDALFPTAVSTEGLHVTFTAQIGGGSGADGLAFVLLDPARGATASSLGRTGGALGYGSLPGVAVTLDTYQNAGDPSANFVGIATGATGGGSDSLTYVATAPAPTSLQKGTHVVDVVVAGGRVRVTLDGAPLLDAPVSVPASALVGFSGGTGGLTNVHTVRNVTFSRSGALPAPTSSGWTRNGSATVSGTDVVLTQAVGGQAGSALYATPVSPAGLHATFTAQIGGGSGADGLAFVLLDATQVTATALGRSGGALGYGSLPGIAVALDTYRNGTDPSANFVGVAKGATGPNFDNLTWAQTSTAVSDLRTGTHAVDVTISSAGEVKVKVDGTQVLDIVVAVPASAYVGFTGGTGGSTDVHTVRDVSITVP